MKIRNGGGDDPFPTGNGLDIEAGGGIFVGAHTTLWLTDADVMDNEARISGGGIFTAGALIVERSTIANSQTALRPRDPVSGVVAVSASSASTRQQSSNELSSKATPPGLAAG